MTNPSGDPDAAHPIAPTVPKTTSRSRLNSLGRRPILPIARRTSGGRSEGDTISSSAVHIGPRIYRCRWASSVALFGSVPSRVRRRRHLPPRTLNIRRCGGALKGAVSRTTLVADRCRRAPDTRRNGTKTRTDCGTDDHAGRGYPHARHVSLQTPYRTS